MNHFVVDHCFLDCHSYGGRWLMAIGIIKGRIEVERIHQGADQPAMKARRFRNFVSQISALSAPACYSDNPCFIFILRQSHVPRPCLE
jgi:hypothetical protein